MNMLSTLVILGARDLTLTEAIMLKAFYPTVHAINRRDFCCRDY